MSYLSEYIKKHSSGGPTTAELLEKAEKSGRRTSGYAQFLKEERAQELAAEQRNRDEITKWENVLNKDVQEMLRLRRELVLNAPETDPKEIELNSCVRHFSDMPEVYEQFAEKDWKDSFAMSMQGAQDELRATAQDALTFTEGELILRYLWANQIVPIESESIMRGYHALKNHGIIRQPIPVAPVLEKPASGPYAGQDALIASLEAQLDATPVGDTRTRSRIDNRLHLEMVKRETLGNDTTREILGEIATQSGLTIPSSLQLSFINFLGSPVAKRRFGSDKSSIRRAFCEFTGNDSFLSPDEHAQIATDRANDACSSDAVKSAVGFRASYNPHDDGQGYRANRSGEGE